MQIPYNEFKDSLVMTLNECSKHWSEPIIVLFVSLILMSIGFIIFIIKWGKIGSFIKENNLQEKYQNWKKLNRGLL